MKSFHVPVVGEFAREPVEQVRVRWPFALQAEVFRGFDDSYAEVVLPDAIDEDTTGKGIVAIDEPAGEVEASGRMRIADCGLRSI